MSTFVCASDSTEHAAVCLICMSVVDCIHTSAGYLLTLVKHKHTFYDALFELHIGQFTESSNNLAAEHIAVLGSRLTCKSHTFFIVEMGSAYMWVDLYLETYENWEICTDWLCNV